MRLATTLALLALAGPALAPTRRHSRPCLRP